MTNRKFPVAGDEFPACVDDELPAERRDDVEAGLAAHPEDAARVQSWRAMAEMLHARYDQVLDEPVPKRLEIERLASTPRHWIYGAAAAALIAVIAGGGVGWIAHGAFAPPTALQSITAETPDAHRLYVVEVRHPVEVPGAERAHLQQWLTKRCGWNVYAPELDSAGLKLVGGRLLPGPAGAASFLMYEGASGERFTVYAAKANVETTQMRYAAQGKDSALFWADRGVGFVVSGSGDRDRLTQIAKLVYEQGEKIGG